MRVVALMAALVGAAWMSEVATAGAAQPGAASCDRWDLNGPFVITQANGITVAGDFRQSGTTLEGTASFVSRTLYPGHDVTVNGRLDSGRIDGRSVRFHVRWSARWTADVLSSVIRKEEAWQSTGVYEGTIEPHSFSNTWVLGGSNFDLTQPQTKVNWTLRGAVRCASGGSSSGEPIGPGMENDTDRPGNDYRRLLLEAPADCQSACAADAKQCAAWTYVRPGVQDRRAVCYLKSKAAAGIANACCVSGLHRRVVDLGKKYPPKNEPYVPFIIEGAAARCKPGFVWREAKPSDVVCVTPESRSIAAQENAAAEGRRNPNGAYGPATCIAGFVWREAYEGDVVCVTPERRAAVGEENRLGPSRTEKD